MSSNDPLFVIVDESHILARLVRSGAHALTTIGYFGRSVAYYSRSNDIIAIDLGSHIVLLRPPVGDSFRDAVMSRVNAILQAEISRMESSMMERINEIVSPLKTRIENLEEVLSPKQSFPAVAEEEEYEEEEPEIPM